MSTSRAALGGAERAETLEALLHLIEEHYVFPDTGRAIGVAIRRAQTDGAYDSLTSGEALADRLTEQLRDLSRDKHFSVRYSADPLAPRVNLNDDPEWRAQYRKSASLRNFGFQRAERLEGNIGYLNLTSFEDPEFAGEAAVGAMSFLSATAALIFDLRQNLGGSPGMVALVSTYLFPTRPVHLNSLYWRSEDRTQQFWTLPYVHGRRYLDRPVYVLTSPQTFSAAEEFAYNLKQLGRAILVGEQTAGGANPGALFQVSGHFSVFIPTGHAINPITGENWEGKGVAPDIPVPQGEALRTAHILALRETLRRADLVAERPSFEAELRRALQALGEVP